MKILVFGNSGSGKTTFVEHVRRIIPKFVHINGDEVRATVNQHLGFTDADRKQQAITIAYIANIIDKPGLSVPVITDFICPYAESRALLAPHVQVWIDRPTNKNPDSAALFEPPRPFESFIHVTDETWEQSVEYIAKLIRANA